MISKTRRLKRMSTRTNQEPSTFTDPGERSAPEWPLGARIGAWALFWLLNLLVAVQDYHRQGGLHIWEPILWEGSSCLVASIVVVWQWRLLSRDDVYLGQPKQWFGRRMRWIIPLSLGFVTLVFAIRHAVYGVGGQVYRHDPWGQVYLYETVKFAMFYLLFSAIFFGVRFYAAISQERLAAAHAQSLAKQAQLIQLAQQIEPHFLFNAIGTITETIHTNPNLADKLLTRLATLLRAATDLTRKPDVTLREELQLLESYGAIMRERFEDRIDALAFEVDDRLLDCRVPSLLLQPLLENAFRHGVEKHLGAARICVRGVVLDAGQMQLSVECNLGELPDTPRFGTGISNLRERLQTRFGVDAGLDVVRAETGGVRSVVTLPCVC